MKVQWTKFAINSLHEIFKYYKGNVSFTIASNIRDSILTSTRQLENQPLSGGIEELLVELGEGHRFIIRGNYKIIYKIILKNIYITDIFDTRQNPKKVRIRNEHGTN